MKIKTVRRGTWVSHFFYCAGCGHHHSFNDAWAYNGNPERPTVTPSLLVTGGGLPDRCHSFITDGKIQYLADCTHALAGQTVELEDIEGIEELDSL